MFLPAFNDIKSFQFFLTFVPAVNFPFLTCRNCETQRNTLTVFFFAFFWTSNRFFQYPFYHCHRFVMPCFGAAYWILSQLACWYGSLDELLITREVRRHRRTPLRPLMKSNTMTQHVIRMYKKNCHIWTQQPGPLEELPRATPTYQSLQGAHTSSQYYNAGLNRGKI